ncbi:uncharacterized protein [Miscanthus floridulus]|uniref:uncharacterized protein n=1 Tax=Miscanthus floridulus TaxID=154761 RepID=UPI003457ED2E
MLHLGQSPRAPLQTILEETPGSESQGSTETLAKTFSEQFLLPPLRGGAIFNVSIDSPSRNGETEERVAQENRNINRAQWRENEVAITRAEAAQNNQLNSQGRPLPLHHDLDEEFLRVDGHDEYEKEYGNPDSALEPIPGRNAIDDDVDNPEGPLAFTRALRTLRWPRGFKITGVEPYEGRMNPTQWLQAYATAVRAARGDTSVMANYLPIMLTPPAMSWFTSLTPDSIESWEELKKVFTDNYMATCTRPGTKHDLSRINQKPSELLYNYIRRFSEMRNSIPNITEAEVITAFIRGLHHRELRSKFNRKPPTSIGEMITTANQCADAEEAEVRFNEDVGTQRPSHRYDDHPDN